jgi:putative CocE/NonD family hydrolase
MRKLTCLFVFIAAFAAAQNRGGAPDKEAQARREYIRANYTKHEYQIAMRDGVKLFTSVYAPKNTSESYPILLNRTPYTVGPYGEDSYRGSLGQSEKYMREGFIFVYQDVRGKGRSEGAYVHVRPYVPNKKGPQDVDETTDTYDTVDWLIKNIPNNNGKVGVYGISYPGFYAAMAAIDAHPAVKAVSPQAPVTEWFIGDDFRHNGCVFLAHAFNFFASFGRPKPPAGIDSWPRFDMGTPDAYQFFLRMGSLQNLDEKYFHGTIEFWNDYINHDVYDEFWRARDPQPYVKNLKPAMMTVGGWFDAEDLYGALHLYKSAEKQNPAAMNSLVMGPWIHGGWARSNGDRLGEVRFDQNTARFYQDNIEFPFFLWHLKGKGEGGKLPEAYVFETGRNEWHTLDAWPPKEARPKTLYFAASGRLATEKPGDGRDNFDEYVSDPAKPVPYLDATVGGMDITYMVADQRYASTRTDVLTYQTEPLDQDLRAAGPLKVSLFVSVSSTDADFVVKLIDVYPDDYPDHDTEDDAARRRELASPGVKMGGYEQMVRGEPFRGKFRNSFEKPEPFTVGKVEKVEFELPDIFHTFRRGHRVMVQVQSSWFPLIDRNPQKFMKISEARPEDFVKETIRVHRSAAAPSSVTLLTLETPK